jgi:hypothetical protein
MALAEGLVAFAVCNSIASRPMNLLPQGNRFIEPLNAISFGHRTA